METDPPDGKGADFEGRGGSAVEQDAETTVHSNRELVKRLLQEYLDGLERKDSDKKSV